MGLLISLLYLLLHIAIVALCAALILWALRWSGVAIDPWAMKIGQLIFALIVVILIISWISGVLPPRGLFGTL
jgi:hypothetical protein